MIECKNLTKIFIKEKPTPIEFCAVDHVSFQANDGEILGILGPNGAGKTTLLRMLVGIMKCDEGEVILRTKDGVEIDSPDEKKRAIGYLSNNTKLYSRLSPREILHTFGKLYSMKDDSIEERSKSIIETLHMEEFADMRISQLSTGQTQRASLARCFIQAPSLFVLDEPTLGLDILSSKTIIDTMKSERSRGKCVIYSTHYMEEAQYLCDRILMMNKGKVIAFERTEKILKMCGCDNLRDAFFHLTKEEDIIQ